MIPNQENIYWLFSSSAQTISTLVAFLVTGFALVLNMMDSLQQKDETYEDIHHKLKSGYYKKVRFLAIITGLAIIFSLWMVYLNGGTSEHKWWLFILTTVLNISAIIIAIVFVISIINPEKYRKAAKELIKENRMESSTEDNSVDQTTFIREFIKLEKSVRDLLQDNDLYVPYGNTPKMAYSFRQMITALHQNELINSRDFEELAKINKYRNLVFHGHQEKVNIGMLDRIKRAQSSINGISQRFTSANA